MKAIFFNIWKSELKDKLIPFFKKAATDTDIFSLQEADNFSPWLNEILKDYEAIVDHKNIDFSNNFDQGTFISKSLKTVKIQPVLKSKSEPGLGTYVEIKSKEKILHLINFHGMPLPKEKLDSPQRLKQSQTLINFLKDLKGPKIIGGDFNLEKDTQSVQMFSQSGYHNLIDDFHIKTTRNQINWNKYPDKKFFSDYVFTSPEVKVKSFTVPSLELSDHEPMVLEFQI